MNQFTPYLRLVTDFIKSGGLILGVDTSGNILGEKNFGRLIKTCARCYLDVSERMKRDTLATMLLLLEQLNVQVISKVENGTNLLEGTTFLHGVTKDLNNMLKDYFDSVRDTACQLLEFMALHFVRPSPVMKEERSELLQILQVSAENLGFAESMHTPTRDAAE